VGVRVTGPRGRKANISEESLLQVEKVVAGSAMARHGARIGTPTRTKKRALNAHLIDQTAADRYRGPYSLAALIAASMIVSWIQ
jgi:hypothetical protein